MCLFLADSEKEQAVTARKREPFASLYWAMVNRVERRAASPGLTDRETSSDWWHFASEYLTDAAMVYRTHYKPSSALKSWLRDAALSVARRSIEEWIGPDFRDHETKPPKGNLETAHLAWSLAIVLDLASELFSQEERDEITAALREKGIALCLQFLDRSPRASNWRCILTAGLTVAAAVVNDKEMLERSRREFALCCDFFQPDGSYGESLQYGNYALYGLMLTREALVRHNPSLDDVLPLAPYALKPTWDAYSLFYKKPLAGWGAYPVARSANFNDSAAIYRPSADILMHIAVRAKEKFPREAGLARWLFDTLYLPCIEQSPHDRASFGFINDFGFLTISLWSRAANPISPEEAKLPIIGKFSCGNAFVRDAWNGRTILAARTGGEPLHALAHHHGDINSFILVHNQERLLIDPGHSCYRNLIHEVELASASHNTCTFQPASNGVTPPLQQRRAPSRSLDPKTLTINPPISRGGKHLLLARTDDVSVIGSEAADLYGEPVQSFKRFWILCGSHVLFVIDHIASSTPIQTTWNWLLNNRDGMLDLKIMRPDRLVARRGTAGMKFFNMTGASITGPLYGYVHDAYHPLPNQLGEGKPGSGLLIRWKERNASTERLAVHAAALDTPGAVTGWHLRNEEGHAAVLESPAAESIWKLKTANLPLTFTVEETISGRSYTIQQENGDWKLR